MIVTVIVEILANSITACLSRYRGLGSLVGWSLLCFDLGKRILFTNGMSLFGHFILQWTLSLVHRLLGKLTTS
jgi:hypothetical protein